MSALILTVAAALATIAVPALLIRLTGGRALIHTDHDLTRPRSTTRRAPRRADR